MKKNQMNKLWKFEQNRTFRSKVMNFQSLNDITIPTAHGLRALGTVIRNLWRHVGQLFNPFVHTTFKKCIYWWFRIRVQHDSLQNTCRINKGMIYSSENPTFCWLLWKIEENVNFWYTTEWEIVRHDVTDSFERCQAHGAHER